MDNLYIRGARALISLFQAVHTKLYELIEFG